MITPDDFSYDDTLECTTASDGDYRIKIVQDDNPYNPRDDDNYGIMYCWHNRYSLGDEEASKKYDPDDYDGWESLGKAIDKGEGAVIRLPLYLYDHSGITISTGSFNDQWDSGQVGWIITTRKQIELMNGKTKLTKKELARFTKYLENEVKTYDDYLRGECYGYVVEKRTKCDKCGHVEWEELDSCWGYLGDQKYCIDEAMGSYKANVGR